MPVGHAVIALHAKIAAGEVAGLRSQDHLFSGVVGHPTVPLEALVAYCHFAVIYRRTPVGLPLPKTLAARLAGGAPWNRLVQ